MRLPGKVYIQEVGPRDGFRAEGAWIPIEKKIEIIDALARCGLHEIQATAFVHPKAIPQLADAEVAMEKIRRVPGGIYRVLDPNMKGLERAIPCKPDSVSLMLSVTECHNRSNANRSIEESLRGFAEMMTVASDAGVRVVGGMACAFGCPFEGDVDIVQLERVAQRYIEIGIGDIGVADTIGVVNPRQVYDVCARLLDKFPGVVWGLHMRNTCGIALANIVAAKQAGVSRFDGSVGGLGGCPHAPGATGNVATEDLVNMLSEMGVQTGVDLDGF